MMASPKTVPPNSTAMAEQGAALEADGKSPTDNTTMGDRDEDVAVSHATAAIEQYLMVNAPIYPVLHQLRAKVSDLRARFAFGRFRSRGVNAVWTF